MWPSRHKCKLALHLREPPPGCDDASSLRSYGKHYWPKSDQNLAENDGNWQKRGKNAPNLAFSSSDLQMVNFCKWLIWMVI